MNICAIVCEYNPFHNGHLYQIEKVKNMGIDKVVCVMSGDFVQRAEPAIVNKFDRTRIALSSGADMVAELPTVYACASGELFAYGSLKIISKMKNVTHIAFGVETDDEKVLGAISEIQSFESKEFKNILKEELSKGCSYALSYSIATSKIAEKQGIDSIMTDIILSQPNNLLAIEYLKAIRRQNLEIKPLFIKRMGSSYNSVTLDSETASATAIRNKLNFFDFNSVSPFIPTAAFDIIKENILNHKVNDEIFQSLVINAIRNENAENLLDAKEGIEIKLKKSSMLSNNLDTILNNTKTKRYTFSRVKRLALQCLLKIEKDCVSPSLPVYSKILGIKKDFKTFLSSLGSEFIKQNKDYKNLPKELTKLIEIDKRASNIYSLLTCNVSNQFYSNKLIEV